MNPDTDPTPAEPKPKAAEIVACRVLVAGVKVGSHRKGVGARIELPRAQAEALADSKRVRIL